MKKIIHSMAACLMLVISTPTVQAAKKPVPTEENTESVELSVPPLDHVEYPSSRPDWCNQKTNFTDVDDSIVVVSGPCDTPEECTADLKWMQQAAVTTYVTSLLDVSADSTFYHVTHDEIDERLVVRRYQGEVTAGGQVKYEHVVELKFTPSIQKEIRSAWRNLEVSNRLGALGILAVLGTLLLIGTSGLLGIVSRRQSAVAPKNFPDTCE